MPCALFLSPHINDVAFSCAGTVIRLLQSNWKVSLVTLFTATLPDHHMLPHRLGPGPAHTDVLTLRRTRDEGFARVAGLRDRRHLDFETAPSRGYESAHAAMGTIQAGDEVWRPLAQQLSTIHQELNADAVFAPQGLCNHVDHLQTILAVRSLEGWDAKTRWYRDMPYALHYPDASASCLLPDGLQMQCVPLKEMDLERKVLGCSAYTSHVDIHFGTPAEMGRKLRAFHHSEAQYLPSQHMERYAECFLAPEALPSLF